MQFADLASISLIVIGALILGFSLGLVAYSRKDRLMANSADQLRAAAADSVAATKAKDDQIASLQAVLDAAQADLAADEAAIAA